MHAIPGTTLKQNKTGITGDLDPEAYADSCQPDLFIWETICTSEISNTVLGKAFDAWTTQSTFNLLI